MKIMKKWGLVGLILVMLLMLLILPVSYAKTQTFTFQKDQSEVIENINVTLLDFNKKEEKIVVCVNNQRGIVVDDKRVNGVYFEIKRFDSTGVKMTLEADCDECKVEDNLECYNECKKHEDCDDGNESTLDYCTGRPRKCVHNKKTVLKPVVNETREGNKTEENLLEKDSVKEVPKVEYFSFFKKLVLWVVGWVR